MKKSKFVMSAGAACLLAAMLAGCQTRIDSDKVGSLDFVPDRAAVAPGAQGDAAARAVAEAVARNSGYPLTTVPVDGGMREFRGVYARVAGPDRVIVTYGHGVYSGSEAEPPAADFLASRTQTSTRFDVTVSPAGDKASISGASVSRASMIMGADIPAVASVDALARDLRQSLTGAP
jgi:hypothetical protein